MKRHRIRTIIVGGVFAAPLLTGVSTYAAAPTITINDSDQNLYAQGANADHTVTYDLESNTLKLANFHGDRVSISGLEDLTILLEGENSLTMADDGSNIGQFKAIYAPHVNLTFTGDGSLTVEDQTPDVEKDIHSSIVQLNDFILDGPTLDLSFNVGRCIEAKNNGGWSRPGVTIIESGTLKLQNCSGAFSNMKDITVNGGSVEINNVNEVAYTNEAPRNFNISGGLYRANVRSGAGIRADESINISGGEVYVNGSYYAIEMTEQFQSIGSNNKRIFSISGGLLDIESGTLGGIKVAYINSESYIDFSGGTIIFHNNTIGKNGPLAMIAYREENDKNIILGKKMNVYPEGMSVQVTSAEGMIGYSGYAYYLASKTDTAVITDDPTKIPDYTEELPDEIPETSGGEEEAEETAEEESDVKTPDTGIFSGETEQSTLLAISLGAVAATTSVLGLALYATKRFAARAKFNK